MAIDYIIEYDCPPKRELTAGGIVERIKERARAQEVIAWFRAAGDTRPPDQMGFEFSQGAPGDIGGKQLIVAGDLLDHAAVLDDLAHHCQGCPANRGRGAYGCVGFVQYPLSAAAEAWLLERLPLPEEPLVWLLLRQGIRALGYDGASVKELRDRDSADEAGARRYLELPVAPRRRLGEIVVSGDQALEMIVGVGERVMPNHAGILLLFFGVIDRNREAFEIQQISSLEARERASIPFELTTPADSNRCVSQFADFFQALYTAWQLNVPLYIDA